MLSSIITKVTELKKHQGFLKYFKNTSWLFAEKIVKIFSVLIITFWLARYLGPEQFGTLNYVISFAFFLTTFANLGLDSIVVKELVQNQNKNNVLLGNAFILKIVSSIIALLTLFLILQFTNQEPLTKFFIIIATSAALFQSFNVIDFFNQAQVISKYTALASSFSLTLSMIIKVILIMLEAPLNAFIYVILFDAFSLAVGLIYFYRYYLKHKISQWTFDWKVSKKLLQDSWPLMLSGIIVSIYMRIDQIMIAEMIGYEANGQYAAAVTLSEAWYFIPVLITSSLFPAIINAKNQDSEIYYSRLQKLYNLMVWLSLLMIIVVTLLGETAVSYLYGEAYSLAYDVLLIHIWAGLFVALGVARSNWIVVENLQHYALLYLGIGVLINIALNFILIPHTGITGAAIATLCTQFIAVLIIPLFFKKTRVSFFMFMRSILLLDTLLILIKKEK